MKKYLHNSIIIVPKTRRIESIYTMDRATGNES